MSFGYMLKNAVELPLLIARLGEYGITAEQKDLDRVALREAAGNTIWGAVRIDGSVRGFWRTAFNHPELILQRIADVTGQAIFSDIPENYGDQPLYVPKHPLFDKNWVPDWDDEREDLPEEEVARRYLTPHLPPRPPE